MKSKVIEAQKHLQAKQLDGWLLYDFHRNNDLAHLFLEIPLAKMTTRRFFYWIPTKGDPIGLVHAIEADVLESWPGEKRIFSSWQSLEKELKSLLRGKRKIAMEYSLNIPYVSKVDGGTLDLIRSFGVEVVSSADFLLYFTSVLTGEQIESQKRAARAMDEIVRGAWDFIATALKEGRCIREIDVGRYIQTEFQKKGIVSEGSPIVAVNAHSADPHHLCSGTEIRKGDFILIDLWGKEKGENSVFGDITRVAVAASKATQRQEVVFRAVREGQLAAISLVKKRFAEKREIQGWEVDEAARKVIRDAGFGDFFIHRTGHNIGALLHGSGTHMDNLEMHDVRPLVPGTCFSIEPGIYLRGEFGIRLESDVIIEPNGAVEVTGGEEKELLLLQL